MLLKELQKTETLHTENGELIVKETWYDGKTVTKETEEIKEIKVRPFLTEPARINMSLSRTIQVRDFEPVKVSVSLTMPCYKEEREATAEKVDAFVTEWLTRKCKPILKAKAKAQGERD
jgi:hypothetical protein